jgi:two-component system response regulator RegA
MTDKPTSVLLIDDDAAFLRWFARALEARGLRLWTARTFGAANRILALRTPSYVISELRISGRWLADYMNEVVVRVPAGRFAVVTAYPSVATAVQLTRAGVAAYLTKPVSPQALFDGLGSALGGSDAAPASEPLVWPTLGRATWEYLSQVCVSAGSLSAAARRLGIDRRSLRRMLSKTPPSR